MSYRRLAPFGVALLAGWTAACASAAGSAGPAAGEPGGAGLDWADALTSVTLTPAAVFGIGEDYGSIEAGKVANLVVWSGSPFELSSRPVHVMIRGELVPNTSRQRELLERYRDLGAEMPPAYRP